MYKHYLVSFVVIMCMFFVIMSFILSNYSSKFLKVGQLVFYISFIFTMATYINMSDNEYIDEILNSLTTLEKNSHPHPADVILLLEKIYVMSTNILSIDIQGKRIQLLLENPDVKKFWRERGKYYNKSFQSVINNLYENNILKGKDNDFN